jgi:foldase protein PrsA
MAVKKKATPAKKTEKTVKSKRVSTAPKKTSEEPVIEKSPIASESRPKNNSFKIKKSYLLWILIPLILLTLLYALRGFFLAATVNGQPITRVAVVSELERQGGSQALNALITKNLILQQSREKNVSVSQKEVDDELKKIEDNLKQQGQNLNQVMAMQGLTRESLIEQIRLQKLIEKMVGKDVKVTDKEVNDYINQNREIVAPEGTDVKQAQDRVRQQLRQQKVNQEIRSWLDKVRKDAKVNCFVGYCQNAQ